MWLIGWLVHVKKSTVLTKLAVIPESAAIVAFAIAWLTKGHAILPD